uniref:Conotoxin n=1 Tax=Conus betulinus TaxID=89764 RepID=A0A1P7ZCP2_CONBE|nr:Conotoxin [Conus betulinus]
MCVMKIGLIICLLLIAFMNGDGSPGNMMYSRRGAGTASSIKRFQKTFLRRSCTNCPEEPCCHGDKCMTDPGYEPFCGN